MPNQQLGVLRAEVRGEALHQVDRPVLAAGAADGDRQVPAVRFLVFRQAGLDERGRDAHVRCAFALDAGLWGTLWNAT